MIPKLRPLCALVAVAWLPAAYPILHSWYGDPLRSHWGFAAIIVLPPAALYGFAAIARREHGGAIAVAAIVVALLELLLFFWPGAVAVAPLLTAGWSRRARKPDGTPSPHLDVDAPAPTLDPPPD